MTDRALKNAERKRDSLAAEINSFAQRMEELKRDLDKIDAWIAQWHELAGTLAAAEEAELESMFGSGDNDERSQKRRATGNPKKEEVAEATRQIILERGEPISRGDLFKALADRGVIISSESDPEMVLSTMLWRMRHKVARLKTGGYWLAERPYAPADHDPAKDEDFVKELRASLHLPEQSPKQEIIRKI
ncbi:MAG: hypothetical protein ACT4O2_02840 [Beijerinckiaceae bacterium]